MKIILPANHVGHDTRVALSPEHIQTLVPLGIEVWLEHRAFPFSEQAYRDCGAKITEDVSALCQGADVVFTVGPVSDTILAQLPQGARVVGLLGGTSQAERYQNRGIKAYALELLPRISRAQFMDVLSSQATLMGYWAVIQAQAHLPKIFSRMTTAAGTLPPAEVLVLGAGVAGLQAIGVAKRMGAKVSACDVRAVVSEQVESLGAKFLHLPGVTNAEATGGYARPLTPEEQENQHLFLAKSLPQYDVVICSALIPGKKAPTLLTHAMLDHMRLGCVVIDLATHMGASGNCTFTQPGQTLQCGPVTAIGALYPLSDLAQSASSLYGRNLLEVLKLLWTSATKTWNHAETDDLLTAMCITK
jgi:NAD(P) transhydrogenase subunit alpha